MTSNRASTRGMEYASKAERALRHLKSIQNLTEPSSLGTSPSGLLYRLVDSSMVSMANIVFTFFPPRISKPVAGSIMPCLPPPLGAYGSHAPSPTALKIPPGMLRILHLFNLLHLPSREKFLLLLFTFHCYFFMALTFLGPIWLLAMLVVVVEVRSESSMPLASYTKTVSLLCGEFQLCNLRHLHFSI